MVPLPELLAFVAAAIVIIAISGPSVLFVIGRALVLGKCGALLSVLGNAADAAAVSARPARLLRESFLVGVSNPKTIVFFVAALPQFVVPSAGSPVLQMLEFGAIFLVLGVVGDSVYAIAAGAARDWFASNPRRLSGMRVSGGVDLIGLGGAMAVTGSTA